MKEFMRMFVEEYTYAIISGDMMAWAYTVIFTGILMKLSNSLGKLTFRKVGDMREVTAHDYHNQDIPEFVCWECSSI
jgi:hypothetical protein